VDVARFKKKPVMGILRGIRPGQIEPLVEAVISSGLETIEITMNTKGAEAMIKRAAALGRGKLSLGAGTVLNMAGLKSALSAGATFIVTPVFIPEVMKYCLRRKIAVFPGAFSPLEIYNAWRLGATMVKVFPAKFFGPEYFKELKGPFDDIKLLACGGVTPENIGAYFSNGASAVSFGASVFRKEWLEAGDFLSIRNLIKGYLKQLPPDVK